MHPKGLQGLSGPVHRNPVWADAMLEDLLYGAPQVVRHNLQAIEGKRLLPDQYLPDAPSWVHAGAVPQHPAQLIDAPGLFYTLLDQAHPKVGGQPDLILCYLSPLEIFVWYLFWQHLFDYRVV